MNFDVNTCLLSKTKMSRMSWIHVPAVRSIRLDKSHLRRIAGSSLQ